MKFIELTNIFYAHNGYDRNYDDHDVCHCIAGATGGLDHAIAKKFIPAISAWRELYTTERGFAILTDKAQREEFLAQLAAHPLYRYQSMVTRNEMLAGFLQSNIHHRVVDGQCIYKGIKNSAQYNDEAEIPFYADEYTVRVNQAYFSSLLSLNQSTLDYGLDNNLDVFIPASVRELDTMCDYALPYCMTYPDIYFCIGTDGGKTKQDKLTRGFSYSTAATRIATESPLIYSLRGQKHLLLGENVTIIQTTPLQAAQSFEVAMTDYFLKTYEGFYKNPKHYMTDIDCKNPLKVPSPYDKNAVYETYIGPNKTVIIPERHILKEFSLSAFDFIKTVAEGGLQDVLCKKFGLSFDTRGTLSQKKRSESMHV